MIARNVASGHGFTADGISATNGFQPLWMWLLIPVAWLSSGDVTRLLAATQLGVVSIFCVSAGLLSALLRARLGLFAALAGTALALVPRFTNVLVSGMESGVAVLVFVCLLRELLRSGTLERPEPARRDLLAGVLFGLLLLARLDAVFAVFACAAYVAGVGLAAGDAPLVTRLARAARKELAIFWPTVALLVPYLAWNAVEFGHVMPISGALKTSHSSLGFRVENLNPSYLALLAIAGAASLLEMRRPGGRTLGHLLAAVTAGLTLQAAHALVFMHWAVFSWHYALAVPVGMIGAAVLAREARERLPRAAPPWLLAAAAAVVVVTQAISISRLHLAFTGAGREAGLWVAKSLPPDAVLGMKDSGAFSYFAQRRVMNLDGVVNSFEFAETVCRGELPAFLERHGVAYVVQHSVPDDVRAGRYESYTQAYPCHFAGGRDSELVLRRDREVFRGSPYRSYQGAEEQLVIWRIAGPDP